MLINVNGRSHVVLVDSDMPLLWVLREKLGLTGTKFGCGKGLCGACTVHVNNSAVRSCQTKVGDVSSAQITTIEGISNDNELHVLQKAWISSHVPQCGYCQPGQIMGALELIREKKNPSDEDIDRAMAGHICRCGTYPRIKSAIKKACQQRALKMRG